MSSPDAERFAAVALAFGLAFFFLGGAHLPTGAPGSSSQSGQNHSPSGTASSGGSRHFKWYGASHLSHSSGESSSPVSLLQITQKRGASTSSGCLGISGNLSFGIAWRIV